LKLAGTGRIVGCLMLNSGRRGKIHHREAADFSENLAEKSMVGLQHEASCWLLFEIRI